MQNATNNLEELREAARLEKLADASKIKPNPFAGAVERLAAAEKLTATGKDAGQELKDDLALYARWVKERDKLQNELNEARAALTLALQRDKQVEYLYGEAVKAYRWNRAYHNGVRMPSGSPEIEHVPAQYQGGRLINSAMALKADGTPMAPLHLSRMTPAQWQAVKELRELKNECLRLESLVRQACAPVGAILDKYPSLRQRA